MDPACALDVRACTFVTLPRTASESEAGVVQDGRGVQQSQHVFSLANMPHIAKSSALCPSLLSACNRDPFPPLYFFPGERGTDLCKRAVSSTKANTNYLLYFLGRIFVSPSPPRYTEHCLCPFSPSFNTTVPQGKGT